MIITVNGIIYVVTNKINGKQYVGQTTKGLEQRKKEHLYEARGKRFNYPLYNAIRKYGEENFEWSILEENVKKQSHLDILEKFWIIKLKTRGEYGYNIREGGSNGKLAESTKKKLSKANRGKNHPNYGKHHTEETRRKISDANRGRKHSEETKGKMKKNHADFSGKNNPNYGKHLPEKTKKKISDANRGRKHSEESRRKMSRSHKGEKHSKEHRMKVSKAHRKGLFEFHGGCYSDKKRNPWRRVWKAQIRYNGYRKSLGCFEDPLSCQIVYDFVFNEIYS